MCMATLIPANVEIPQQGLENGADTNKDGHGYAIASSKYGLEVFRSMVFDQTMDSLLEARKRHGANSVVLFHSRFGTHGEMGPFNIHPFFVGDSDHTVMAHNGILPSQFHPKNKDRRSDTRIFVDHIAAEFCDNANGVPSRRGSAKLAAGIGSYNKLAFLSVKSGEPKVRLVNASAGVFTDGLWYSNDGYKWSSSWSKVDDWWGGYKSTRISHIGGEAVEVEECPNCYVGEVDPYSNCCLDCDFCLDCYSDLKDCLCYTPEGQYRDQREIDYEIQGIEDAADDGWVKVGGVWCQARSLVS